MSPATDLENLENEIALFSSLLGHAPWLVLEKLPERVHHVFDTTLSDINSVRHVEVLTSAAGLLVDAASDERSMEHLVLAETWLEAAAESDFVADGVGADSIQEADDAKADVAAAERRRVARSMALYFLGNARIGLADRATYDAMAAALPEERPQARALARWAHRDRLRRARRNLTDAARSASDAETAAMAHCNLANTFDHSGRWIEAYDAYVDALQEDPTNGAAAGNAALLIGNVIRSGWDYEGQLCGLHDKYLRQARAHRSRTVQVVGEDAARLFDTRKLFGHPEEPAWTTGVHDDYAEWVGKNRLALVAGFEGLGKGEVEGRWDTIVMRQVIQSPHETGAPVILSMLNVLKADFLVARRLAFEALQTLDSTEGWAQDAGDPGVYVETLQYAVVGEVSAKLVLAHRAALDVLDKTAVAVNEHLQIGDRPGNVKFRSFWFKPNSERAELRAPLMAKLGVASGVLAMAELAFDMDEEGIHAQAHVVRNAGTHRFVLVHHGLNEVDTTRAMHATTLDEIVATSLQTLKTARAAFIYLVAMLSAHESERAARVGPTVALPMLFTL